MQAAEVNKSTARSNKKTIPSKIQEAERMLYHPLAMCFVMPERSRLLDSCLSCYEYIDKCRSIIFADSAAIKESGNSRSAVFSDGSLEAALIALGLDATHCISQYPVLCVYSTTSIAQKAQSLVRERNSLRNPFQMIEFDIFQVVSSYLAWFQEYSDSLLPCGEPESPTAAVLPFETAQMLVAKADVFTTNLAASGLEARMIEFGVLESQGIPSAYLAPDVAAIWYIYQEFRRVYDAVVSVETEARELLDAMSASIDIDESLVLKGECVIVKLKTSPIKPPKGLVEKLRKLFCRRSAREVIVIEDTPEVIANSSMLVVGSSSSSKILPPKEREAEQQKKSKKKISDTVKPIVLPLTKVPLTVLNPLQLNRDVSSGSNNAETLGGTPRGKREPFDYVKTYDKIVARRACGIALWVQRIASASAQEGTPDRYRCELASISDANDAVNSFIEEALGVKTQSLAGDNISSSLTTLDRLQLRLNNLIVNIDDSKDSSVVKSADRKAVFTHLLKVLPPCAESWMSSSAAAPRAESAVNAKASSPHTDLKKAREVVRQRLEVILAPRASVVLNDRKLGAGASVYAVIVASEIEDAVFKKYCVTK